jgi:hypothetical protein
MKTFFRCAVWLFAMIGFTFANAASSRVTVVRAPDGGLQPQAVIDAEGTIHVIYYKGDAGGGDIFYVRQGKGHGDFSQPIRVNTQAGSAIAAGTIRGAQLALGRNGRLHVVWNGGKGAPPVVLNGKKETPLLYTRSNEDRTGFEPERNLITYAAGLDGGSSVAADHDGKVHVFWHGRSPDGRGEPRGVCGAVQR